MSYKRILGICFICGTAVTNYRYRRNRHTFKPIFVEGRGVCHEGSCYDTWNPPRGFCVVCRGTVRQYDGTWSNGLVHKKCIRTGVFRRAMPIQQPTYTPEPTPVPSIPEPTYRLIFGPAISIALNTLLTSTVMAPQVYCGITIAKLCYSSWTAINRDTDENQDSYLIKQVAKEGLTYAQERAVWSNIKDDIPADYRSVAHNFVSNVVSKISEEEINFVSQFI